MAAPLSCEQCEALLADYVLHVLEPADLSAVLDHLSTCERCQAAHTAYVGVIEQLAQAVPQHEPPTELMARLLTAVQSDTLLTPAASTPGRATSRLSWQRPGSWLLTAANIVLCLGVGWWTWQVHRDSAHIQQRWQEVQQQLLMQRQTFTLLTAPAARPVPLRSDQAESQARGVLLLQPEASDAALIVQGLPPLHQDRAYQLWLGWGDRQRDNGGVFHVDAQGFALLHITAPRPFAAYQRVGITEEPAGGSPGPTSPRVIGALLQGF